MPLFQRGATERSRLATEVKKNKWLVLLIKVAIKKRVVVVEGWWWWVGGGWGQCELSHSFPPTSCKWNFWEQTPGWNYVRSLCNSSLFILPSPSHMQLCAVRSHLSQLVQLCVQSACCTQILEFIFGYFPNGSKDARSNLTLIFANVDITFWKGKVKS